MIICRLLEKYSLLLKIRIDFKIKIHVGYQQIGIFFNLEKLHSTSVEDIVPLFICMYTILEKV